MRNLLFDTPWWVMGVLLILAAALLISGNNRQDKNLKRGGLFFLAILMLLAALSYFVDTDIEKVQKRMKLMVSSVEKRDWKTFESLLDPRVRFAMYDGRDKLVAGASATADRIGLKSAHITSMQTTPDGTGAITVNLDALSVQDATMERPVPTSWRFEWLDSPEGWVITTITPLPNGQVTPDRVTERLVRPN